jgi:hypothetical protein
MPHATWGQRLRGALLWAGVVTILAIAALAAVHFAADMWAVVDGPGRPLAILRRVGISGILGLAGLALVVLVAWLAGGGRRRELAAIGLGFAALVLIRVFLAWQFDAARGEPTVYPLMADTVVQLDPDFRGRPPGYAIALAGTYLLFADRQLGAEALNLLMAVLAGGAVPGLARGLYGARPGALALLGYALWPAGALMTSVPMPHIAFDLVTIAAAWAAVGMPPGWRGDALSGAILGLGQYMRPLSPFLLPSWILARVWGGASLRSLLVTIGVTVGAFLLVLLPVMAQSTIQAGWPGISTSDYGGHSFFIGTYEPSGGMYTDEADQELRDLAGPVTLRERSGVGMRVGMERIREDPLRIAALAVRKQDTLWGTEHYGIQYALRQGLAKRPQDADATVPILVSQGFYVVALLTAALGLATLRHRPDALVPLAVTLIWVVAAMHGLLEVRDRHHAYVMPLLLPWSALAISAAWDAVARRRAPATPV